MDGYPWKNILQNSFLSQVAHQPCQVPTLGPGSQPTQNPPFLVDFPIETSIYFVKFRGHDDTGGYAIKRLVLHVLVLLSQLFDPDTGPRWRFETLFAGLNMITTEVVNFGSKLKVKDMEWPQRIGIPDWFFMFCSSAPPTSCRIFSFRQDKQEFHQKNVYSEDMKHGKWETPANDRFNQTITSIFIGNEFYCYLLSLTTPLQCNQVDQLKLGYCLNKYWARLNVANIFTATKSHNCHKLTYY